METPDLAKLREEVLSKLYAQPYTSNPDGSIIFYAKEIARKNKIKVAEILKGIRPRGVIRDQRVWDENGKIVPYEKIFGRR